MTDEPTATCALCGLPNEGHPVPLETQEGTLYFCCEGCRGIYQMLHGIESQATGIKEHGAAEGRPPKAE